jgi:hypothetical protein
MNRVDKDRPSSFPAQPMDQPRRREIPLTDSENGEFSSPENEAAVSEGWPISTRLRFGSRIHGTGAADHR